MAVAERLSLRCFMEGIEVPIISASLTIQPDAPATCNIQIPATDRAHEFLPRTLIHVFFYDYYEGPGPTFSVITDDPAQVLTSEEATAAALETTDAEEEAIFSEDLTGVALDPEDPDSPRRAASGGYRPPSVEEDPFRPNPHDPGELPAQGGGAPSGYVGVPGEWSPNPHASEPDSEQDHDEEDRRWKLFFVGEVIGYQFVKSAGNRAIILNCLDTSLYWDTCYQYKVNVASLTGNGLAHFVGAGTTLFDVFFQSSTSSIVDVVNRRSHSRPELTGLLSGVVHLLERVGGVYTSHRGFRGVNDFFSLAELRLHLIDMIGASEDDTTSQRLFPRRAFNRWTRREGGQLGKIASFREILNLLNKFIFHNTFPNPIAKYDPPVSRTRDRTLRSSVRVADTRAGRQAQDLARRIRTQVRRYQSLYRVDGIEPEALTNRMATIASQCRQLETRLRRLGARQAASNAGLARGKANQVIQFVFNGNRDEALLAFAELLEDLEAASSSLSGATRSTSRTVTTTETTAGRLYSQIIRPDIYMCAPPRCNILFPELYSQVQFTRQYLREVTRMRLKTSDEIFGPDSLLDNVYYAPDVEVLGERTRQGRGGSVEGATLRRAAYSRRLMDHELYTGVVPVFERMNEVNIAAGRSNHVTHRGARVPFAARAANFQFFKHRFSPRSIVASGKFNPYVVAGFPMMVLDRYMSKELVTASNLRGFELMDYTQPPVSREREGRPTEAYPPGFVPNPFGDWEPNPFVGENDEPRLNDPLDAWMALRATVPTQFVGLVTSVTHNITQQSAATNYTLTAARTHREREELLGANRIQVARRDEGQATRFTTVAALEGDPPRVGQLGPWYGQITAVERVERQGQFHLYGTFGADRPRRQRVRVRVNQTQAASAYGPEVVTLVGERDRQVTFRAYRITEEVDRWSGMRVHVPLEDFLRPPWMSDVWANPRIGGVYNQILGIGSITDQTIIDTGGGDSATPTEDAALRDAEAGAHQDAVQDPFRAQGMTVQEAEMAITVERAIDLLVRAYSVIRQEGHDVHEFIRGYTWRPVANIIDVLGSRDLRINQATGVVERGEEGFHSRAFGHGEMGRNIRNLIPADSDQDRVLGISESTDRRNLLVRLDKRASKAERVMAYADELYASRGQLG